MSQKPQPPINPSQVIALGVLSIGAPKHICQLALARWRREHLLDAWQSLTNPHTKIPWPAHPQAGLSALMIKEAESWPLTAQKMHWAISDELTVVYGPSVPNALHAISHHHRLSLPAPIWLDAQKIAAHVWPNASSHLAGHCAHLGLPAMVDASPLAVALATGQLLFAACRAANCQPADWLSLLPYPQIP